jgi:glucose/arabinose dehydrogenase
VEVINSDLQKPWGIINLPDGRFLITSKTGYLNIVSADGKTISKVEGFQKLMIKDKADLLDVRFRSRFCKITE